MSKQLTTPNEVSGFLEKYKAQIKAALPRHMTPDRMARIVLTEVSKNQRLLECDTKSLMGAIIQASQLGLEPGIAGHAYLIPFYNGKNKRYECQFLAGYKGLMDLATRSGKVQSITPRCVYDGDVFDFEYGDKPKIVHKPKFESENLICVYAVVKLSNGETEFEVMPKSKIEKVKDGVRKKNKGDLPQVWIDHEPEMAMKTVIRHICKYIPSSVELQQAVSLDEMADSGISQNNYFDLDADDYSVEKNGVDKVSELVNEQAANNG